jgi:hypothetical protein
MNKRIRSLAWKLPGADSFSDISDAIKRPTCEIEVKPPKYSSRVGSVRVQFTMKEGNEELEDEVFAAMTDDETVELSLSLQGIDEQLEPLKARFDTKAQPPFGNRRITAVVEGGKQLLEPHV